jgi:hypothetical protein
MKKGYSQVIEGHLFLAASLEKNIFRRLYILGCEKKRP